MTLELEPLETGNEHLAESGWTAGISFDPEGDEELMEEDRAMAERREERKKQACGGFTSADNTILRAHFAFMAHWNGVSVSDLANATAEGGDTDGGEDLKKAAALSMARACGGTPGPMPRELVALLMRQYTPAGVIELVNTLSLVSMLQRWTSIYMPKQYEPEVLVFVEENGSALSLDPTKPCTEEQSGWRELAAEIRSS
ncbi:unnamed protein product [Ectocarpus sp. 6 AP-2014]